MYFTIFGDGIGQKGGNTFSLIEPETFEAPDVLTGTGNECFCEPVDVGTVAGIYSECMTDQCPGAAGHTETPGGTAGAGRLVDSFGSFAQVIFLVPFDADLIAEFAPELDDKFLICHIKLIFLKNKNNWRRRLVVGLDRS